MKELEIKHPHFEGRGLWTTRPRDRPGLGREDPLWDHQNQKNYQLNRNVPQRERRYGLKPFVDMANDTARSGMAGVTAAHVRSLAREIERYRDMPEQKQPLGAYVEVMRSIHRASTQLLSSLAAMPDQGRGLGDLEVAASFARDFAGRKLLYYNELRALSQPHAIARIKDVVENRFKSVGGKHLVNMVGHDKHLEYFVPTHYATQAVLIAWNKHFEKEHAANRDPYDSLVDFLLTLEPEEDELWSARGYLDADSRYYYRLLYQGEVKALGGERLLYALYRYGAGHRGARYEPHLDGHDALSRLACRYLPYNTSEYANQRASLSDLIGGDLYVMDSQYRLYTCYSSEFHSRLLAGNPVMGAGVIVVKEGKVRAIDNKSGHYQPTWKHLHQVVCELEFHGVFAPDAIVGLMIPGENIMFFAVDDFIELGNRNFSFEATRGVIERYHEAYRGGVPVPPSQLELLPSGDRQWPDRSSGANRWKAFLKKAFPKTLTSLFDGVDRLLKVVCLPTLADWKKESDAGLFAGRHEAIRQIDSGLEHYHRVLATQAARLIPDGDKIADALNALDIAINYWLLQKQDAKESTRRPKVVKLQQDVQAAKAILPKLKLQAAQENLALVGIQV
jgi:hypothetical protein